MSADSASPAKVQISPATMADLAAVRKLFRAYRESADAEPCFRDFERELAELPGCYAQPDGAILLARLQGRVVGCAALSPLGGGECELKRLFVVSSARGQGLGQQLVASLIAYARQAGYRTMRLETLPTMIAAKAIYRQMGFEPYTLFPGRQEEGVEHQGLRL